MKSRKIHDECWNADIYLVWPVQNEQLDAFIKRELGINEKTRDGSFLGRFCEITTKDDDEDCGVIALAKWKGTPRDHSVLAHECLHAVGWFLRTRGIKLSSKTEETYCYFLDSLVRRCLEHLNKK